MVTITPVDEASIDDAAALVAELQADPGHHIGYLGQDPAALVEQLRALEPRGLAAVLAATDGGRIVGLLGAEWDDEPPRVWWHGPMVGDEGRWDEVADRLYSAGRALLPDTVVEQELAPEDANERVAAFAQRHGFVRGTGSAVLERRLDEGPVTLTGGSRLPVRRFRDDDRASVAALHDALFPDTHLPGHRIDEGARRIVLVALDGDDLAGYVAAEIQEDEEGYLDYLGVDPRHQRQGIGALLIAHVCEALRAEGCPTVGLTVREDNPAARALYDRLGFIEERVLVPWRIRSAR